MGFTRQPGTPQAPAIGGLSGLPQQQQASSPFMAQAGASPAFNAAASNPNAMQNYWAQYQAARQQVPAVPISAASPQGGAPAYRQAPVQLQMPQAPQATPNDIAAIQHQYQQYMAQYPNTAAQLNTSLPAAAPNPQPEQNAVGDALQQYLANNPFPFSGYLGSGGTGFEAGSANDLAARGYNSAADNHAQGGLVGLRTGYADGGLVDRPYANVPDTLMGFRKNGPNRNYDDTRYPHSQKVKVTLENGEEHRDEIKGMNREHALERARRNWPAAAKVEADDDGPGYAGGGLAGFEHKGMAGSTPRGYRGARAPGNVRLPGPGGGGRLGAGGVPTTGPGDGSQGLVKGPGTGTSDSVHAPKLSNGEFVMTKKAVDGAGKVAAMHGDRSPLGGARLMYSQMRNLEMAATRG